MDTSDKTNRRSVVSEQKECNLQNKDETTWESDSVIIEDNDLNTPSDNCRSSCNENEDTNEESDNESTSSDEDVFIIRYDDNIVGYASTEERASSLLDEYIEQLKDVCEADVDYYFELVRYQEEGKCHVSLMGKYKFYIISYYRTFGTCMYERISRVD